MKWLSSFAWLTLSLCNELEYWDMNGIWIPIFKYHSLVVLDNLKRHFEWMKIWTTFLVYHIIYFLFPAHYKLVEIDIGSACISISLVFAYTHITTQHLDEIKAKSFYWLQYCVLNLDKNKQTLRKIKFCCSWLTCTWNIWVKLDFYILEKTENKKSIFYEWKLSNWVMRKCFDYAIHDY